MRSDTAARPLVAQRLIEHGRAWAVLSLLVMSPPIRIEISDEPAMRVRIQTAARILRSFETDDVGAAA
jgi:hypothetical protein